MSGSGRCETELLLEWRAELMFQHYLWKKGLCIAWCCLYGIAWRFVESDSAWDMYIAASMYVVRSNMLFIGRGMLYD